MDTLDKIDIIRQRMNVSYQQAKQALEESDGDILEALILLEKYGGKKKQEQEKENDYNKFRVKSQELVDKLKEIIKEGNVSKISIKNEEKTLLEIPVTAGVVSLVLFPYITILAGLAAMFKEYTLEINRKKENVKDDSFNVAEEFDSDNEY